MNIGDLETSNYWELLNAIDGQSIDGKCSPDLHSELLSPTPLSHVNGPEDPQVSPPVWVQLHVYKS